MRAKFLRGGLDAQPTPLSDAEATAPAFTLTSAQLSSLVSEAVTEALEAHGQGAALLVDKQTLAHKLGCSATHVDHLRKRGLPIVRLGDSVRFEIEAVLTWLRLQSQHEVAS